MRETYNPNMSITDNRASAYVKQKLIEMKKEINKYTIMAMCFNIPLSATDRTTVRKSARIQRTQITKLPHRI